MTTRKKFRSRTAQQEGAGQEQGEPTIFTDEFLRCKKCFCSKNVYGMPNVPTLMIREIIRLKKDNEPSVDIGSVIRCGNPDCNYIHDVKPFRLAGMNGISKNDMLLAVAGQKGTPSFTLDELTKNRAPYNPNEHIEPKITQQDLAL